jgi:hypothetical protein
MKNPRFKTVYLLLLLFFSFGWMIDKSEAQNKNPFLSLTEAQLLSLPGKSIKDSLVQALINCKECYFESNHPHLIRPSESNDSSLYNITMTVGYISIKFGIALGIEKDTICYVTLYNERHTEHQFINKYNGILPYGLSFSMKPDSVDNDLSKHCFRIKSLLTKTDSNNWICYDKVGISIDFDSDVLSEAKIIFIQVFKI